MDISETKGNGLAYLMLGSNLIVNSDIGATCLVINKVLKYIYF